MTQSDLITYLLETSQIYSLQMDIVKMKIENGNVREIVVLVYDTTITKKLVIGLYYSNISYDKDNHLIKRFALYIFNYKTKEEHASYTITNLKDYKIAITNFALYQCKLIIGATMTSIANLNAIEIHPIHEDIESDLVDDALLKKTFADYEFGDKA
jgi:hypothetical protein